MITIWQIRKIHTLKNILGMDDDTYREILHSFDVCSSKQLTEAEAKILIQIFEEDTKIVRPQKYDELIGRSEIMATPKQIRMMEAIWKDAHKLQTTNERKLSLRKYLRKYFHIWDIRFLTKAKACKIIPILIIIRDKKLESLKAV